MDLIIYTLKSVATAIVEPLHLLMLIIMGIMFYLKNRRISIVQKMTIGESLDSPLELTLSQIVLGIIVGALGSLILSLLGITFSENSGIIFPSLFVNTGIAPLLPSTIINKPLIKYITPTNVIRDNISTFMNDCLFINLASNPNIKFSIANIVLEYGK